MRQTVIPAQITTVEDKIAGNLNLTQILILMVPVFWTVIVYSLLTPAMHLAWYKLPLILAILLLCLVLSLRIKGKVLVEWLFVLFKYNLRPKYYVFDKNDVFLRDLNLPVFNKKPFKIKLAKEVSKQILPNLNISDFVKLENLIKNPKYTLSFKSGKKGGLNVAFSKIKK